jgi:tight adherence protein B
MVALFGISSENLMVAVLPVIGSMLLAFGIFQVVFDLRKSKRRRLMDRLADTGGKKDKRADKNKQSVLRKRIAEEQGTEGLDKIVASLSVVPKFQRMLDQANIDWSASRALVNLIGLSILLGAGAFALKMKTTTCVGIGVGVFGVPMLVLWFMRKRRMKKLVEQLPDVFELLGQALRAGHSLASGIHLVNEQLPDPAGTEFGRVFYEQNLGIKVEEALTNMANRVDQLDVRFFVTAVLIQRQTGGDLAEILDKISAVIRDRIKLFGTVRGLTAEGRLSGWVLVGLPVLVFFIELSINPSYAEVLLYDPQGKLLLYIAIGMCLMGLAMIRKIVNIKV